MKTVLEIGEELAEMARKGAMISSCGKMCKDCAFNPSTKNTPGYENAIMNIETIIQTGYHELQCHIEGIEENEPTGTVCVGFQYARNYLMSGCKLKAKK